MGEREREEVREREERDTWGERKRGVETGRGKRECDQS